jgi:hypothetical protein
MLRKLIPAGAIVVLFAGPAVAQDSFGIPLNQKMPQTREEIERQNASDRAYDAAMKKIPDKKLSVDPWGNIRPSTPTTSKNKQQQ